jgi:hypothetical protein
MDVRKRHSRGIPLALAIAAAAFGLVIVFFAKVAARLVMAILEYPAVSSALHRAARALGLDA